MKKKADGTRRTGVLSLQWRLTLMTAAVVAAASIALTVILGRSADLKMSEISEVFVEGDAGELEKMPVSNIQVVPEAYQRLKESRVSFRAESLAAMAEIILVSSLFTYFIVGRALCQLEKFSDRMEKMQIQNLSEPMDTQNLPKEIRRLCLSYNKMLIRLEEAFAAQKQFSANAAHELRTPLAVMQAKIEVFQKAEHHSEETYGQLLHMLCVQTERLSHIVNELLDMTDLQMAERTGRIELDALAEEVTCDLESLASEKEVRLIHLTDKRKEQAAEAVFYGNEVLIYRAVYNLVENAVKYNRPGGEVRISAGMTKDRSIRLLVEDTGCGIPKEYQEQIFEPFFRVDKSRSREMGGAGIGLAMVKKIAQLHGGTVFVEESSQSGSRIVLEIPEACSL